MIHSNTQADVDRPERRLLFSGVAGVPVVHQTESAECGLACLAMVAAYYGYEIDLVTLRRKSSLSSRGANLITLMQMADGLKLASRAVRLDLKDLGRLKLPAILHWDLNHFVVLKSVSGSHFWIHDPAMGRRRLTSSQVGEHFTGVALELTPTEGFEKKDDSRRLLLSTLWSRMRGFKRSMAQLLLLAFVLQVLALVSPLYMQTIVDKVLPSANVSLLTTIAVGFGLMSAIVIGISAFSQMLSIRFGSLLSIQMGSNLFRHLIRLPMDYFGKRHMGDVLSRLGALGAIQGILVSGTLSLILNGFLAIVTLTVMFTYSSYLTAIVLAFVAAYAALRFLMYRPFRDLTEEDIIAKARLDTNVIETLRAVQTVKLFQKESERLSQWQNLAASSMNKGIRLSIWGVGYGAIRSALSGAENILIVMLAAKAVIDLKMTLGMLYAYVSFKGMFVSATTASIGTLMDMRMLGLHMERVSDIALTTPEEDIQQGTIGEISASHSIVGRIEVTDLQFAYSKLEPPVLDGVRFVVEPGKIAVITGPSGGGKSTLIKCLMGLLKVSGGQILVDGQSIDRLPGYRSQIAGVMQDDILLSGTIAENIACMETRIDMERVMAVAELACVHTDIHAMPMRYDTLVGDLGASLSGGQRQRIAIARALYRQPKILFLDEATSHVDIHMEEILNHNIRKLGITSITAAHRRETVAAADYRIHLRKPHKMHQSDTPQGLVDGVLSSPEV